MTDNDDRHSPPALDIQLLVCRNRKCSSYTGFTCGSRGLKYVSKHRTERIRAIASVLASSDYDIITLQELWVFADFEYVRSAVSKKLPYAKFFYRCVLP